MAIRGRLTFVLAACLCVLLSVECASIAKSPASDKLVRGSAPLALATDNTKAASNQGKSQSNDRTTPDEKRRASSAVRDRVPHPYLERKRSSTSTETPVVTGTLIKGKVIKRETPVDGGKPTVEKTVSSKSGSLTPAGVARVEETPIRAAVSKSKTDRPHIATSTTRPVHHVKRATIDDVKPLKKEPTRENGGAATPATIPSLDSAAVRSGNVPNAQVNKRTQPSTNTQKPTTSSDKSGVVKRATVPEKKSTLGASHASGTSPSIKTGVPSIDAKLHQLQTSVGTEKPTTKKPTIVKRSADNIKPTSSSSAPVDLKTVPVKDEKLVHSPLTTKTLTSPATETRRNPDIVKTALNTKEPIVTVTPSSVKPKRSAEARKPTAHGSGHSEPSSVPKAGSSEAKKPTTASGGDRKPHSDDKKTPASTQNGVISRVVKRSTVVSADKQKVVPDGSSPVRSTLDKSAESKAAEKKLESPKANDKIPHTSRRVAPQPFGKMRKTYVDGGKSVVKRATAEESVKKVEIRTSTSSPTITLGDTSGNRIVPASTLKVASLNENTPSTAAPLPLTHVNNPTVSSDIVPTPVSSIHHVNPTVARAVPTTSHTPAATGQGDKRPKRATTDEGTVTPSVQAPSSSKAASPSVITKLVETSPKLAAAPTTPSTHIGKVKPVSTVRPKRQDGKLCEPFCTGNYQPVCASEGSATPVTFHNECQLRLFNCRNTRNMKIVKMAAC